MTALNLREQFDNLVARVRASIGVLDAADSMRQWFAHELAAAVDVSSGENEFEDLSARMRAVRQLGHMIADHQARLQNPQQAAADLDLAESIGTTTARIPAALLESVKLTNFSIEPSILLNAAAEVEAFDAVSPTAKVVGYLRCMDPTLAFAHHLSFSTDAERTLRNHDITDPLVQARMSILFCSRYRTINAVVARLGHRQILEIASGISPRGLQWSRENPRTVYIESDLPRLMRQKAKILRNSIQEDAVLSRGVLHCCGIDALDLGSIRHALEYTDPRAALTIVTEGLLLYFNADEMKTFMTHMATILAERPAATWVVDLVSRTNLRELFDSDREVALAVKTVFAATGRPVVDTNPFQSADCITRWLEEHNLCVESRTRLSDILPTLALHPHLLAAEQTAIVGTREIWAIRCANQAALQDVG